MDRTLKFTSEQSRIINSNFISDTSAPSPGAGFGMNSGEIIPNSYPITSVNHPVQVRIIIY